MKIIKTLLIYCILAIAIVVASGCNDLYVYQGGEATANTSYNVELRKLQNIQTIQFECINHPEYQQSLPKSITEQYTKEEIKQAFKNLKWKYNE